MSECIHTVETESAGTLTETLHLIVSPNGAFSDDTPNIGARIVTEDYIA